MHNVQFQFGLVGWLLLSVVGCSSGVQTSAVTTETVESVDTTAAPADSTSAEPDVVAAVPDGDAAAATKLIIDVRSKEEWDTGHVGQAKHIPHTEIAAKIFDLTSDKDAKIILYCAVGGRAGKAKEALEKIGFTNVENAGGYEDMKKRLE